MIDWWLGFLHHTEEYKWWHPRDHVWSDWEVAASPGEYIGRTHLVHEYVGGHLAKLRISFKDQVKYSTRSASRMPIVQERPCGLMLARSGKQTISAAFFTWFNGRLKDGSCGVGSGLVKLILRRIRDLHPR